MVSRVIWLIVATLSTFDTRVAADHDHIDNRYDYRNDTSANLTYFEGDVRYLYCSKRSPKPITVIWKWKPTSLFETIDSPTEINEHFHPTNLKLPIEAFYNETEGEHFAKSILRWSSITRNASGTYSCQDSTDGQTFFTINLNVIEACVTTKSSKPLIGSSYRGKKEKLKIFSEILPSGCGFRLTCTLRKSVEEDEDFIPYDWIFPHGNYTVLDLEEQKYVIPLESRAKLYLDSQERNQWIFEVRNASYLDTGLYSCVDLIENRDVTLSYIYVQDKTQMILPTAEEWLGFETRNGTSRAVVFLYSINKDIFPLGCGPTDPSVTIDLWNIHGEKLASTENAYSSDASWTFNPFYGFQLNAAITWDLEGDYVCSTADKSQERRFQIIVIGIEVVAEHEADKFILNCKGRLIEPFAADLTWHWNPFPDHLLWENYTYMSDDIIKSWNCSQEDFYDGNNRFFFNRISCEKTPVEAAGSFKCIEKNSNMSATFNLTVSSVRNLSRSKIVATVLVTVSLVLLGLFLLVYFMAYHRQKKNRLSFRQSLANLLEGNLSQINLDSPLDGQVELLPYESKWEFPESSLFLEKQIGFGHFGRVVKARAVGITPPSTYVTEVAVKMVKSRGDLMELKSLVCELKILVHLGSHLNVVNLLGAVTSNIKKGCLMVIVEYCRNGNLKDYIIRNRSSFVSELDTDGNMKPVALPERQRIILDNLAAEKDGEETGQVASSTHALVNESIFSGERKLHKKFSSSSRGTRSSVITTSDLLEWSYEIASGMFYLTQKKVIHGDIAARNILLADDNVVKIADFGLARKFYQDPNYHKMGNEALPVKWMAIESIRDGIFSSKSDVWSFGVTLWELFSLGQDPYAEIDSSLLLRYLLSGNRLEKPENAPNIIGDIMRDCWKANPEERSTFDQHEEALGCLLTPELLALYKIPYDRYGYISTAHNFRQAALRDEIRDVISDSYLELGCNQSQAPSLKSDSTPNLASNNFAHITPPEDENNTEIVDS